MIVKDYTAKTLPGFANQVMFEPFARAGDYWRAHHGYTHTQRFAFVDCDREYWGEIIRVFDKAGKPGKRTSVSVELRTHSGTNGNSRSLPETHKAEWRKSLIVAFKAHLEEWLNEQESF